MPTPPQGTTVVRLPASTTGTLVLKSNTWYAPAAGLTHATVTADTGCYAPNGTANVKVFNVNFVGNGDRGYGIDMRPRNGATTYSIRDIEFVGGSCRNFTNGASIHAPNIEGPNVHRDIAFRNWRFMDTVGAGDTVGQGIYGANIDGLTFEDCFWSNIGIAPVREKTHGAYIAYGCKRVVFRRCIGFKIEHAFLQARGPGRTDTADSGLLFDDCLAYDVACGYIPMGPKAMFRNCTTLAGHSASDSNKLVDTFMWASVGELTLDNCLLLRSPVKGTGFSAEPWHNKPRTESWGWPGPCRTNGQGVTRLDVTVDLSDLEKRGRAGEPIGPLVAEAQARCRKAVA